MEISLGVCGVKRGEVLCCFELFLDLQIRYGYPVTDKVDFFF